MKNSKPLIKQRYKKQTYKQNGALQGGKDAMVAYWHTMQQHLREKKIDFLFLSQIWS